jgi:hypothetical protein
MDTKSKVQKTVNVKEEVKQEVKQEGKQGVKPGVPSNEKIKKKRSIVFKKEEVKFLAKLVSENKTMLESKTTSRDVKDIAKKARAWTELTTAFNAGCKFTGGRTVHELRKKWENLKTEAKKQASERKKEQIKTGGGKAAEGPVDEVLVLVEDVIQGAMGPVTSRFDSNSRVSLKEEVKQEESEETLATLPKETVPVDEVNTPSADEPHPPAIPNTCSSSSTTIMDTPRPNKRKLDVTLETPAKTRKSNQTKATDAYNRRAEELHDTKTGFYALKTLHENEKAKQAEELHDAEMGLIALRTLQSNEEARQKSEFLASTSRQKAEFHAKKMELIELQIERMRKGHCFPFSAGGFVEQLEEASDIMNLR